MKILVYDKKAFNTKELSVKYEDQYDLFVFFPYFYKEKKLLIGSKSFHMLTDVMEKFDHYYLSDENDDFDMANVKIKSLDEFLEEMKKEYPEMTHFMLSDLEKN